MKFIKPAVVLLFLISIAIIILSFFTAGSTPNKSIPSFGQRLVSINKPNKLTGLVPHLKTFTKENKLNEKLCFLIDMSKASGTRRFSIFDLETVSVKEAGLVTHGRCNEEWMDGRKYSNAIGSGCTALGKYKVGHSYAGKFGLAYKLHGLEKTNSNAFKRFVVLHAHSCVPDEEVSPLEICQRDGCPTVSPLFLKRLHAVIKQSGKPVLLYIFQ